MWRFGRLADGVADRGPHGSTGPDRLLGRHRCAQRGADRDIAARSIAAAKCAGVALRKEASTDGEVIVRAKAGTKVRVVETVTGDAYEAGSCGTAGDTWLKVDRVGGKSIQTVYGVPFGFVAAGFFE